MNNTDKITKLKEVRKLISNPKNWCKGSYARDRNNKKVEMNKKSACKFCIAGAVTKVSEFTWDISSPLQETLVLRNTKNKSIVSYNDNPAVKHKHILKLIDDTIERLTKTY